jgi:hypothetical protein
MNDTQTSCLFIVGSGRSGTTLVYEQVIRAIGGYYFTNIEDKIGTSPLVSRIAHSRFGRGWKRVIPSEGYRIWDMLMSPALDDCSGSAFEAALADTALHARLRDFVNRRLRMHGRRLFINKNTRNSARVRLLAAAFPTARFVHIVRHPLAAVNSLLQVAFWKDMPVWFKGGQATHELARNRTEEVRLAAQVWVHETEAISRAFATIPGERCVNISYEEYVEAPAAHLDRIASLVGCERNLSLTYEARLGLNQKFLFGLSSEDRDVAATIVRETAQRYGYALD